MVKNSGPRIKLSRPRSRSVDDPNGGEVKISRKDKKIMGVVKQGSHQAFLHGEFANTKKAPVSKSTTPATSSSATPIAYTPVNSQPTTPVGSKPPTPVITRKPAPPVPSPAPARKPESKQTTHGIGLKGRAYSVKSFLNPKKQENEKPEAREKAKKGIKPRRQKTAYPGENRSSLHGGKSGRKKQSGTPNPGTQKEKKKKAGLASRISSLKYGKK